MSLEVAIRHRLGDFALDVDFDAPAGVTVLFGRSGSGKTSVVNAIAGLLRPDAGRICLSGRTLFDEAQGIDVPVHRRRTGYVFQEHRLFPHLTVRENLLYSRRVTRQRGPGDLVETARLLGIEALLDRRPGALSGGEAQRVAIGRALLSEPDILLMDEPLAALDEARKAEILPYLERLRDRAGLPILYVSHNLAEVARLANHLVLMEAGRVMQAGPPGDLLSDPALVNILGLREAGAVIPARVTSHAEDGVTELAVSGGRLFLPRIEAAPGTALRVRILAQDVMIATEPPRGISALNVLPVEIASLRYGGGPGVTAQLRSGGDMLLARVTRRSAEALNLAEGTRCYAVLKSVAVAPTDIGGPG
ncbi:molybdenum ABC transporter ATP-binding protein [Roseivivax halodurans JCM 10272]|uniref:Molybdenum ABC transporter ATP-binding protein n=1 Tax=Roseivivax halodurans JCM 10272 TaxID=1449350 RepID=X7EFX2_9RHOB|nr:molybdenum ABC transporter ATP-binding protein [Roseivivax halodurans]ETX13998.1 molybdenum ABC transporter ATP-binding protein [Roseivivax halodurans JCM 10272]